MLMSEISGLMGAEGKKASKKGSDKMRRSSSIISNKSKKSVMRSPSLKSDN